MGSSGRKQTFDFCSVLFLAIVWAIADVPAHACKYIEPDPQKVPDHFTVRVDSFAEPVPDVKVSVRRWNKNLRDYQAVADSITDAQGIARFEGLQAGEYSVSTDFPLNNDSVDIVVLKAATQPVEQKISLHWPPRRVLHLRSLKGSLVSFPDVDEPSIALQGIRLTLLEGYSGRETGTQLTASNGTFNFSGLPPGLYFLRLSEGLGDRVIRPWGRHDVRGDIPIEINATNNNAVEGVTLQIAMSSCSTLMYKEVAPVTVGHGPLTIDY